MKILLPLLFTACTWGSPPPIPPIVQAPAAQGHNFTFVNHCSETVWVGSVGDPAPLGGGGWELKTEESKKIAAPVGWTGRFWPSTGCSFNAKGLCPTVGVPCCTTGSCLTADNKNFGMECAYSGTAPISLVEMALDAAGGRGPYDDYDTSFVDGWSVPVKVEPVAGTFNPDPDPGLKAPWCITSGCNSSPVCPEGYSVPGSSDSCNSPCQIAVKAGAANANKMCCVCSQDDPITCPDANCAGQFGCTPYHDPMYPADMICDPWNKDPSRAWDATAQSYIANVKATCPGVYSWQFDDAGSTYNCRKTGGLVDYTVTFCPAIAN